MTNAEKRERLAELLYSKLVVQEIRYVRNADHDWCWREDTVAEEQARVDEAAKNLEDARDGAGPPTAELKVRWQKTVESGLAFDELGQERPGALAGQSFQRSRAD